MIFEEISRVKNDFSEAGWLPSQMANFYPVGIVYAAPIVFARLASLLLLLAPALAAAETLTSLATIRALSPEAAATRIPVQVEGTVTFAYAVNGDCFIHDGKAGLYVGLGKEHPDRAKPKLGDRVRVEGVTASGLFLPIVAEPQITILSSGPLLKPRRVAGSAIFAPSLDCDWIEFSAMPNALEKNGPMLTLTLVAQGWRFRALLPDTPDSAARAAAVLNRPCVIRAVAMTVPNQERQMAARYFGIPTFDQIIVKPDAAKPEARLRSIGSLLLSGDDAVAVRIRGVVIASVGGGLYIRGEKGAMFVRPATVKQFAPGTEIEAVGWSTAAPYRPELGATSVEVIGTAPPPVPLPLPPTFSPQKIAALHAELTVADATVLALRTGEENVIVCDVGGMVFEVTVSEFPPPRLGRGDRIRVTGICRPYTHKPLLLQEEVDGFRILTRSPEDILLLARAPWWTLPRVLIALGIVAALAAGALVWAWLLRRQVEEKTRIIARQIERDATQQERERIARELHDTVEQELTGIAIQLGNARLHVAETPHRATAALELAQRMLGHCRKEARASIRDLRSIALEQRGLAGALAELLPAQVAAGGAQLTFHAEGTPAGLAATDEIHLLRIAQEAVANAARHAAARNITVRLHFTPEAATLEVGDDGCGFDPEAPPPRGHFGLCGIRERANKLRATLAIQSAPGAGTRLRLSVPVAIHSETI